jgi:alpha-beta hydrolase superfamily lysophospholipase
MADTPAPGTLRRIAHHLANHGIASLRWDRRGFGASGGEPGHYGTDLEDATSCVGWLTARPEIASDRVGVMGHSAGALIACRLCRDIPAIAAAGFLGALASPIEDM